MKYRLLVIFALFPFKLSAQLPYYPPSQESNSKAFIGGDVYAFGIPFSLTITADFNEKNSFRVGISPTTPDREDFIFSVEMIQHATFYMTYSRLIGEKSNHFEIGGGVLAGPGKDSPHEIIPTPSLAMIIGVRSVWDETVLFRAALTPIYNSKGVQFFGGFGISFAFPSGK
jgi:hypothetical protein